MVNEHKKLWAHYEQVKSIFWYYFILFFAVPFFSLCFSYLAHSTDIEAGVQGAVKIALTDGLKWYAIIMPVITVLFIIWFISYSDRVEFTANAIKYYRLVFSKKSRNISYDEISECVCSDGLWLHSGKYEYGRRIRIFNKNNILLVLELNYKLCLSIISNLREKKVRLVDDNRNLKTIDNYFKIDFMGLSYKQQISLLKFYCKVSRIKYRTGEEILHKR